MERALILQESFNISLVLSGEICLGLSSAVKKIGEGDRGSSHFIRTSLGSETIGRPPPRVASMVESSPVTPDMALGAGDMPGGRQADYTEKSYVFYCSVRGSRGLKARKTSLGPQGQVSLLSYRIMIPKLSSGGQYNR